MAVVIRLQGLPVVAGSADIRRFFSGLNIPDGGVHIIGGESGEAFIIFATDEDARQAMSRSGGFIKDSSVKLFLSSKTEMQHIIEISRKRFDRGGRETITGSRRTGSNLGASGVGNLSNLVEAIKKGISKSSYGSSDILEDEFHSSGSQNSHANLVDDLYLFVRGMPYSATEDDVRTFFSGLKIDSVLMIKSEEGQQNGDGMVKFATLSDANKGRKRNRQYMGSRFLEVYRSNRVAWIKYGGRVDQNVDHHFDNEHLNKERFSSGREHSLRRESSYSSSEKYSHSRSPSKVMVHSYSRDAPKRAMARSHSRSPPRRAMARSHSRSPRKVMACSHSRSPRRAMARSHSRSPRKAMARSHSRSPPRKAMARSRSRSPPRRAMARSRSRSPRRAMARSRSRSPRRAVARSRSRSPRRAMARSRSRSQRSVMARSRSRSPRRAMAHSRSKSPSRRAMAHSHSRSPRRVMARSRSSHSGSSQSHLHHNKEYYIHIKNLSVATEKRDLKMFFGQLEVTSQEITFFLHGNERKDAFVMFKSEREYKMAQSYDKEFLFDRQLQIIPISKKIMSQILKSSDAKRSPEKHHQVREKGTRGGYSGPKTCVYIRNFPFDVTNVEVQKFFAGFNIDDSDIHLLYDDNGIGLGEALVKFRSEDQAQKAESLNRRRFLGTEVLLRCIPEEQMQEFGINVSSNKMQDHFHVYDRGEHFCPVGSQGPAMQGNIRHPSYNQQSDNFICAPEGFGGPPPFPEFGGPGISGGFPDSRFLPNSNFSGGSDSITVIRLKNIPFRASPNEILDFFHGYKIIPESLSVQHKYGMPSGEAILALVNYGEAMAAINELNDRPFGQRKVKLSFA